MNALTKAALVNQLYTELGLENHAARTVVDSFFEEIRQSLERGEPVKLSGFGNFELREKRQRPGRNPKTGEMATVSARRVVTFRPGDKLRDYVLAGTHEHALAKSAADVTKNFPSAQA